MSLIDKVKAITTRPAEFEGEPILVKVYPKAKLQEMQTALTGGNDEAIATVMSEQFLTPDGKAAFPAEFLLSDDCPNFVYADLARLFLEVNAGVYKKK